MDVVTESSNLSAFLHEGRRRFRRLVLAVVGLGIMFAMVGFLSKREFKVEVLFYPAMGKALASGVSGLAAQFGLDVGGATITQNPSFYSDLGETRAFRLALAEGDYRVSTGEDPVTLADALEITDSDKSVKTKAVVRRVGEMVTLNTSVQTGVISLAVVSNDGILSHDLAVRSIQVLDSIVTTSERRSAARDFEFMADRLKIAESELRAAEAQLARFWKTNRQIDQSPELQMERDRLERTVRVKQEILTVVAQASERARLEGAKDTPRIVVLQAPYLPLQPESRRVALRMASGLMLGSVVAVAYLFLLVWADRNAPEVSAGFRRFFQRFSRRRNPKA